MNTLQNGPGPIRVPNKRVPVPNPMPDPVR